MMKYFHNKYGAGKLLFFRTLSLCLATAAPSSGFSADVITVAVNGQIVHQTMEGFGSTIRVFDDPHVFNNFNGATQRALTTMTRAQEDKILDLLYVDLGLTRVRPATDRSPDGGSIEPQNDNSDPNETDLSQFNFEWKNNDAFIDLVGRLRLRGVTNYFLSPIEIESWMYTSAGGPNGEEGEGLVASAVDPAEYIEWAMAIISRWADQGVELPFYSFMNEPGFTRGGIWSADYMTDVIKLLGPKLEAAGFATKIIAPDDINARFAEERLLGIMGDPDAAKYVGAFGYHLYGDWPQYKEAIKRRSLANDIPVWMTEWSPPTGLGTSAAAEVWVDAIHDQISDYNVSAVDHMWGFFGEWEPVNTHFISLQYTGATYTGYRINKNYYLTGQYSRYVRPGFQRIDVSSTESNPAAIKCTAYTEASDFVQVCANTGGSAQAIQVNLSGVSSFTELQAVRTSYAGSENWAELPTVAVSGSSFSVTLPARSVTTYFYKGAVTPPPETTLSLALAQPSINENGGTNTLTVSRIGSTESALLVNLNSSDTSEATLPPTLSILAGSSSSAVIVNAVDDMLDDSDQSVTLTASAVNAAGATIDLIVLDDEGVSAPQVALSLQLDESSISENNGTSTLTVSRTGSTENSLIVALSSNDISEATLPSSVTIASGRSSNTVVITAINDDEIDGDQSVIFSVTAIDVIGASINIMVVDDEVAEPQEVSLSVQLAPSFFDENSGVGILTVSRTGSTANELVVSLNSNDTTEAILPASVTILAGSASRAVNVSAVDDSEFDGTQFVTLSASAENANGASAVLTVFDNEVDVGTPPPLVSLSLATDLNSISENGGTATLTVLRTGSTANELLVTFSSSDTSEAILPEAVTIRAGLSSYTVLITAMDDAVNDGDQLVTLTASAGNATEANVNITVLDDDTLLADTNPPELTGRTWTIHGTTGGNTTKISIGDQEVVLTTHDARSWSLTLPLLNGQNTYEVITTKVVDGETSIATRNIVVTGPVEQAVN